MSGGTTLLKKWELLQAIMTDGELSGTARIVAARLLSHLNTDTGRCSPSYQTVADALGLKRRAVIYAVQDLEARGWLSVSRVSGGDASAAKGYVTNAFTFHLRPSTDPSAVAPPVHDGALPPVHGDALPPGAPDDTPPGVSGDTPPSASLCTPGVHDGALPPVHGDAPKYGKENTVKEYGKTPPTSSRFDEWWQAYPRRDGKIAARKAFDRVRRQNLATEDELIAGAQRYAEARAGQDPQFTKMPTTWLNGGHWADEPAHRHSTPNSPGQPDGSWPSATAYLLARRARRMSDG